ncbi:hypothetical protein FB45DRAFT_523060 [Roridomyces roridus]|uniref:F-box domain-containing protein n=1 Tax=Roridomyces roridus TaxID=1738132 RepID=A0AAD7FN67_9AGAR|nr:hypothetical protein FB45DRAFT_523060 [Roridomyces roridus]
MASSFALSATRARIEQLDIEIEKLQRLMDPLLAEREQCQQTLLDYKYPILTLPAEITSEIFLQFIPSYPEGPSFIGTQSPSFLLRICRRWRDVALTTPALWSAVQLLLYNSRYHAQQRDLLKSWLQRSGKCALSIRVDCLKGAYDDGTIFAECVEALLCHASRRQEIDISLTLEELRSIAGTIQPMPLLRSVTIGIEDWEERPEVPVPLLADAPALKHVVLYRGFDPFVVALPWSQITTLVAEALCAKEAVEVLRHTTMLQDCHLGILDDGSAADFSMPIPSLPLRSLKLQWETFNGGGADEIQRFFSALHLPVLQTLSVREDFLGPNPIATLSAVRPTGYPKQMEVLCAFTPREDYEAAFPLASFTFGPT